MSMPLHIQMLVRYNAWANDQIYQALEAGRARAGQESRWADMLKTLSHANVVDQIWQAHLEGRCHGFTARNTETIPAFEALHSSQKKLDEWYIDYANTLPEKAYEELVPFVLIGGNPGVMTRSEILLHVVNHKTYHRGYVAQMLYDLGLAPPGMDLPIYFRDAYPQRTTVSNTSPN